jgi:hypothetical protein
MEDFWNYTPNLREGILTIFGRSVIIVPKETKGVAVSLTCRDGEGPLAARVRSRKGGELEYEAVMLGEREFLEIMGHWHSEKGR